MAEENKPRYFVNKFGVKFREFGVVADVTTDERYLNIYNTQGHVLRMIKSYYHWVRVGQKAKRAIGHEVVVETGASASSMEFFRDVYGNFPPILNIPEDAGEEAATKLVSARCRADDVDYRLMVAREELKEYKDALEQQSRSQKEQQEVSAKQLEAVWPSWEADPIKTFLIVASAYSSKSLPDKLDKAFALRLGIDTTKMKRINVTAVERTYNNNINVRLQDYDNIQCQMALIKGGTDGRLVGEWCIQTVMNDIRGWQKLEEEMYPDWRSSRKPIEYYLEAHRILSDALVNRAA